MSARLKPVHASISGHWKWSMLAIKRVEAARVLRDEVDIDDAPGARGLRLVVHGEQRLRHADEHGEIATRLQLVILRADPRLRESQQLDGGLRIGKTLKSALTQRIEGDDRRATFAHLLQLVQHARAVDPYILTEEHHVVGMVEVFDF